jgi:PAS domain S-box-containing protein
MERLPVEPANVSLPANPAHPPPMGAHCSCLDLAIDAAELGWWQWDLSTGQLSGNPCARELLGLPDSQPPRGAILASLVHPDDRAGVERELARMLVHPGDYQREFRVFNAEGGVRWLLVKGRSVRGPEGQPIRLTGVLMDTTDRKHAEEELQKERNLLRTLIDQLPLCIYVKDAEGRFIAANKATARIMGAASPADLLGKTDADYYPPEIAAEYQRDDLSVLGGAQVLLNKDEPHVGRTGQRRDVLTTKVPFRDAQGQIVGLVGASQDVTEQKQAQQALAAAKRAAEAANEAKSQFLANMSHEIRTPMTAILGFAELLSDTHCTEDQRRDYLSIIQHSGHGLLQLIDDILDLSKIEAGRMTVEPIPCSPVQIVDEVAALMQVRTQPKGVSLVVHFQPGLPEVIVTDPTRLRQILLNLVGNAVKFTERGEIAIEVVFRQLGRPMIEFAVSDTGIGIPAEQLADIFRPFTQADTSSRRRFRGSGLGLTISRRLARMLGGDISVESQLGRGSRFVLSIAGCDPAELDRPTVAPCRPAARMPPEVRQLQGRLLVAEDTPMNRQLIQAILVKAGLEVDVAENGVEVCRLVAGSAADGRPYDLILMDIQMPELDGYDATRQLRQAGWQWPIVALTAHAMADDREKCLEAGCDDYISKPISRDGLLAVVSRYLPEC